MIKMLHNNVLLKEKTEEQNTLIILTDEDSDRKYVVAEVISAGPSVSQVKPGDTVYLSRYEGITYEDYLIVQEYVLLGTSSSD